MSTTSAEWLASDATISVSDEVKALHAKYSKVASAERVAKVQAALEKKNHKVVVVADKAAALKTVIDLIPQGASIHNPSSTTLHQIGFVEFMKTTDKWDNLHAKVLAEKDEKKAAELRRLAIAAEYAICSVDAVTEDGDFVASDASGTRLGVFHAAGQVIIVIGANKLVADMAEATERSTKYCYNIESARVRALYSWPASSVSNTLICHTHGLMPQKFHFVIINESLGF